jgi:hypothetical protein
VRLYDTGVVRPAYRVKRSDAPRASMLSASSTAWRGIPTIAWGDPPYRTQFQAAWTGEGLFARFDAEDDSPWHTMTNRDDHLWDEEVVEIFVDPDGSGRRYAELEISPANVVCDVRMIAPWPSKESDLSWDFAGLETQVVPLLTESGSTSGWIATALMPWGDFATLGQATAVRLPPNRGDRWRFNVFRIKRPGGQHRPNDKAILAAWCPTGTPSFHVPDAFADLVFEG